MKNMRIKLTDSSGQTYHWSVQRVPRACNCICGRPNRIVSGWQYTDHDGYARFAEGTWRELVAAFQMTAENYGFTSNLS